MMENKHIESVNASTIQCDNPECDYVEAVPFEEFPAWINKPCPKCAQNLLTEEDYERALMVHTSIDLINSLSPEELEELSKSIMGDKSFQEVLRENPFVKNIEGIEDIKPNGFVNMTVSTHKEIGIDIKKANS